jgi:hypothetical protein
MMSVYLQSTTEENLYLCIFHGLWGASTNKLSQWRPGDLMIAYVDRALAALFEVTSGPYYDETEIWPRAIYPHRAHIHLEKVIHPKDRYSISSPDTREVLSRHHRNYATTVVLNVRPLHDEAAELLLQHIDAVPAWHDFDAASMLDVLRAELPPEEAIEEEVAVAQPAVLPPADEYSPHTQMQFYLAKLGRAWHYQVWIPKADQHHICQGVKLGELSLPELPQMPFPKKVQQIVSNIDVIWLRDDSPACLFEVEYTTNVSDGILRMSDLITMIPALDIGMFICASAERGNKVRAEITR